MTKWQIALGIIVSSTVVVATLLRVAHSIYRFARTQELTQDRLGAVEAQLAKNGGNSARDVLDKIHGGQGRLEQGQQRAATLAGEAATLAGTADQRIRELGEVASRRHQENQRRLTSLEDATREERIRREFYLATLRELYGIELDDPRD